MLHDDIIYLAGRVHKYATIQYTYLYTLNLKRTSSMYKKVNVYFGDITTCIMFKPFAVQMFFSSEVVLKGRHYKKYSHVLKLR